MMRVNILGRPQRGWLPSFVLSRHMLDFLVLFFFPLSFLALFGPAEVGLQRFFLSVFYTSITTSLCPKSIRALIKRTKCRKAYLQRNFGALGSYITRTVELHISDCNNISFFYT